jgi:hypothetical protein
MLFGVQACVYYVIEQEIVMFDGECTVTVAADMDAQSPPTTMQCGEFEHELGKLESAYLHHTLINGEPPAAMCVKYQSEYLKEVTWKCKLETRDE